MSGRWPELDPGSYLPLPWFPWESRPKNLPIDPEEVATALFLKNGDINAAATRLRVTASQLDRTIRKSVRLTRLRERLNAPESERNQHI